MAHDGKTQREAAKRAPGPGLPERPPPSLKEPPRLEAPPGPPRSSSAAAAASEGSGAQQPQRRAAKRRPAGVPRAANDDVPSIGGLIFALQQKPSNRPFMLAAAASGGWLAVGALLAGAQLAPQIPAAPAFLSVLASPMMVVVAASVCLPIALFWFLAILVWRAQELKLMSSAMTEVAVRLAEPDRAAEQSAASLGQAVRRQVSFMNEAISRALGRAGELEALVHNEVSSLEKSYGENEHKIKGLIQELVGERHALVSTTDKVAETLKSMGSEVPTLIEKLSQQQIKLAKIIEGAGQNLIALENQLATASGNLENALANRTQQLQAVLDDYTVALDATLASRAEALDMQLVERTRALDAAFSERLSLFDESMLRSTVAIDQAVSEKARALTVAMENHVRSLSDTLGRQATDIDESMMHGINAVRRSSDSITRQSMHAIESLSSQADLLKNVSENLLHQMSGVTNRFGDQGKSALQAASALDQASSRLEGSIANAETRTRSLTEQLAQKGGTAGYTQQAMAELERLRAQTDVNNARAIEDMRNRQPGPSHDVAQQLGAVASRFHDTSDDLRARAARAAVDLQLGVDPRDGIPPHARDNPEAVRGMLNDQLRALEQLSTLSGRERQGGGGMGAAPPLGGHLSLTAAFAAQGGGTAPPAPQQPPQTDGDRWSLTDLLARASRDEDGTQRGAIINVESIARALDPNTASAIWSRFRAGQRGIMVRSIYTNEGRNTFDEISARYKNDVDFHRTVDRFLNDFEWLIRNIEQKDPSGRSVHNHLVSDSGRVYLFLAHASGRLR